MRELAVESFVATECEGMARIDFFVRPDGEVVVNEINTIPGFTSTSVYAKLFEAAGIPYAELLDRLIELALERHERLEVRDSRVTEAAPRCDSPELRARRSRRLRRASASSQARRPSSSSASDVVSGQSTRMQFPSTPAFRSRSPRCSASSITASASSGAGSFVDRVANELDREHRAHPANVPDPRPARLPIEHPRAQSPSPRSCARSTSCSSSKTSRTAQCGGERDGIADERPADRARVRIVHDRRAADHAGERQAAGDRLRDDDEIRLDAEVLHREHPPGPSEARLHLVRDEHDPVLVADPRAGPRRTPAARGGTRPRPAAARTRSRRRAPGRRAS